MLVQYAAGIGQVDFAKCAIRGSSKFGSAKLTFALSVCVNVEYMISISTTWTSDVDRHFVLLAKNLPSTARRYILSEIYEG